MSASTGAAASWRERGTGASVLVAGISSAFGVLILTGVGYLTAIISADPTVGDVRAVRYTLSILGTVILGVSVFVAAVVTANTFATIVAGRTREGCIMRLKRALEEMVVSGVKTSIPLHQALMSEPDFIHGDYTIKWLEEWLAKRSV